MEKSDHRPLLGPSFLLLLLLLSSIVCGGHVCWPMVILVQVSLVIITTFTVTNLSFPTAEFFSQLSFWVMDKWGLIFISKIFLIFMIMAERLLDKALMLFFFFLSFSIYLFCFFNSIEIDAITIYHDHYCCTLSSTTLDVYKRWGKQNLMPFLTAVS